MKGFTSFGCRGFAGWGALCPLSGLGNYYDGPPSTSSTADPKAPTSRKQNFPSSSWESKLPPPILCPCHQGLPIPCPWPHQLFTLLPVHTSMVSPVLVRHPTQATSRNWKSNGLKINLVLSFMLCLPITLSYTSETRNLNLSNSFSGYVINDIISLSFNFHHPKPQHYCKYT